MIPTLKLGFVLGARNLISFGKRTRCFAVAYGTCVRASVSQSPKTCTHACMCEAFGNTLAKQQLYRAAARSRPARNCAGPHHVY